MGSWQKCTTRPVSDSPVGYVKLFLLPPPPSIEVIGADGPSVLFQGDNAEISTRFIYPSTARGGRDGMA